MRAAALAVPPARPTRIATRTVRAREFVLVWIDSDDGLVGIGLVLDQDTVDRFTIA